MKTTLPKNLPSVVIVTGTPGTGKTVLARKISKKCGHIYIDVNEVVKQYKLSEGYDKKRDTKIVDEAKLSKVLERIIKETKKKKEKIIIDSHMSHCVDPKLVGLCIVTKCDLKKLEKRLKKKGYSKAKINENMECEIMDICYNEAKEKGHKIKIIDTFKD
ncbi:MAG: AAA family ATPase [Candidatus Woesearchaeota archaeon]|nr:AAA family ATPase [Candidatus Woesearchaeota archaeon]